MALRIKICGVRRAGDVLIASQLGVHAVGLNFVPESPRYIGEISTARRLIDESDTPGIEWAGVFVNPSLDFVRQASLELELKIIQLHGEEAPQLVRDIKAAVPGACVWKALRAAVQEDLAIMQNYVSDGFVVDAKVAGVRGGSGQTFDWNILQGIERKATLILSGGLKPANVAAAVAAVKPDWVDVASGVESAPGVKNSELIRQFVLNARQ